MELVPQMKQLQQQQHVFCRIHYAFHSQLVIKHLRAMGNSERLRRKKKRKKNSQHLLCTSISVSSQISSCMDRKKLAKFIHSIGYTTYCILSVVPITRNNIYLSHKVMMININRQQCCQ